MWSDDMVTLGVLRSALKQVGARLMDAVDPELVRRTRALIHISPAAAHPVR